ncbi:MAG: AMP-binding protein [Coriobacteriia bacterium]|nr:AMP-binding protein [Coriobacteriia bacterium]MCL2536800.1 AMP-binding protein [Coriobacteriia bacterium]
MSTPINMNPTAKTYELRPDLPINVALHLAASEAAGLDNLDAYEVPEVIQQQASYAGPFTDLTIGQFLEKEVAQNPDQDFLVMPDRGLRWSYAQFDDRVNALAKGMLAIGLRRGMHLGVWARNVPDWLTFMFAAAKIGVVMVTMNSAYKAHELAYVLEQADLDALAVIDSFRDVDYVKTIRDLVPESQTMPRGFLKSERFPHLKHLIYMGPEKHKGFYSMPELLILGQHTPGATVMDAFYDVKPDDVAMMQYTSGTTGFPKGVQLSHRNILNNGYYIGQCQQLTTADRVCLPVPLFHCFGCVLGVMAVLTHGATHVLLEEFNPFLTLSAIEKERATALYGVPTMFIAVMNHPDFAKFDLTSLRTGIMAGSPCPVETMKQVMTDMHCSEITIAYGLTETSPVFTMTTTDDPPEVRAETVGKAMPHADVRVIDPETGEECGPNQVGELCCRGYQVMKGYYKMPAATVEAIDADGFLHSGDLGTVDDKGYYRVTGRIKDMIIRGGENIYPREIEEFLYTLPEVQDVQVVAAPDGKYGELPAAFIILKPGAQLDEVDVKEACYEQMARFKAPKYVLFVDEFPLTTSGKIMKYKMREQLEVGLADGSIEAAPTYHESP